MFKKALRPTVCVHLKVLYYSFYSSECQCFLCLDQDTVVPLLHILSIFELFTLLTTTVFTSEILVNGKTIISLWIDFFLTMKIVFFSRERCWFWSLMQMIHILSDNSMPCGVQLKALFFWKSFQHKVFGHISNFYTEILFEKTIIY